jgi:hypothetical protein
MLMALVILVARTRFALPGMLFPKVLFTFLFSSGSAGTPDLLFL